MVPSRKNPGVIVFGATGLLGSVLCPFLTSSGFSVLGQSRGSRADISIDPLNFAQLTGVIDEYAPDAIVNLIAATSVERCEDDVLGAFVANVMVPQLLGEAVARARQRGVAPHLLHVSTDHLYAGPGPHREAGARPCNVYALTKYAGELAVDPGRSTILRTNFVGRSKVAGRASLSDWVVQSLRAGKQISVYQDVMFSALHVTTLCRYIALALQAKGVGIFNVGCSDGCSKAQFAIELARHLDLDARLLILSTYGWTQRRVARPLDMRMDASAFEERFNVTMPAIAEQIRITAQEYSHV